MKILYYDCFSGISGDMNLGAMIDLGIDESYLRKELEKLNVGGWELVITKDQRHGIKGTKVTVRQTGHEHAHRHLSHISKIINDSALDKGTKDLSLRIFMKVAEAEAKVHDIPVEKVHFHEVGAIDSIVDIVGAAICFRALKVDRVYSSELELGGGMVKCAHGLLPVPAPATAEIVRNIPVKIGGTDFEATTPTGAAIIATLATGYTPSLPMKIEKSAYGIGHKDNPNVPNLLRVLLGESVESESPGHQASLLECNIDDMNPEFFEYIQGKLFSAGASDVYLTNIIMKKGRPGIILNVICENEISEQVKEIMFTESTTLGIRSSYFSKDTLSRNFETVGTVYGPVNVKRSFYKGKEVSCKPEFDDCKRIASETGEPLKEVYRKIISEISKNLKGK